MRFWKIDFFVTNLTSINFSLEKCVFYLRTAVHWRGYGVCLEAEAILADISFSISIINLHNVHFCSHWLFLRKIGLCNLSCRFLTHLGLKMSFIEIEVWQFFNEHVFVFSHEHLLWLEIRHWWRNVWLRIVHRFYIWVVSHCISSLFGEFFILRGLRHQI